MVYSRNKCMAGAPAAQVTWRTAQRAGRSSLRLDDRGRGVLGRVALGVERGSDHRTRVLDDVFRRAVEGAELLRIGLDPLGAAELHEEAARWGQLLGRIPRRVKAATGPARHLGKVVDHALAGEGGPACLRRGGPEEERRCGLLSEL